MTEEMIKRVFPSLKAVFYAAGTVKYFAKPFLNLELRSSVRIMQTAKRLLTL